MDTDADDVVVEEITVTDTHECPHCEEIAAMHDEIIALAASQAVNASDEEDAALAVLADALEIPEDEPVENAV